MQVTLTTVTMNTYIELEYLIIVKGPVVVTLGAPLRNFNAYYIATYLLLRKYHPLLPNQHRIL
jgi:hypothetical protein